MSNSEYIIDIIGTQTVDGERDVIKVTTTGDYTVAPTGNRFIRYNEYDNDNPAMSQKTVIKICENQISIVRKGGYESQLILELNKRHQCHYATPMGSLFIGVYTNKMDIELDENGGRLSVEYTLDFDTSNVSENAFNIIIRKN
ncbi:MAG: DUF1934 domain-containing protein [Acutalibacteraceae bacterium]|nr:DUF1934 domain-containing protein [Acutalibacteraceae bacterium]